jgi:hypothetical protein
MVEPSAESSPESGARAGALDLALLAELCRLEREKRDTGRAHKEQAVRAEMLQAILADQMLRSTTIAQVGEYTARLTGQTWARHAHDAVTRQDVVNALQADGLSWLVYPAGYDSSALSGHLRDLEDAGLPIPPNLARVIEAEHRLKIRFTKCRPSRRSSRLDPAGEPTPGGESAAG